MTTMELELGPYLRPAHGVRDELSYASAPFSKFVPQKRTLQAVQIWSVGPDGIDDGGSGRNNGKDYIRFIIPIRFVSQ